MSTQAVTQVWSEEQKGHYFYYGDQWIGFDGVRGATEKVACVTLHK